jgi:demethylmenaquinone methyltransferase/2-methoxy-6-polyprenyl-1,4-benzoquinol methylase
MIRRLKPRGNSYILETDAGFFIASPMKSKNFSHPSSAPQNDPEEMSFFGFRRIPAREKGRHVLRHFNSIAGKYDFMNTVLSFGLHHFWKRWAVEVLQLKPGDRVIDVCGGTADLSILAGRMVGERGRVFLYDINRAMMEGGKPKVSRASLNGRVCYVQGDAERISSPQWAFDAALVGFGVRNLTHMEKGLAEMHRVLKPGGKFMCLEFSLPTSFWFRSLYDFYSFHLMPLAGKLLAGTRKAYLYLPESIRKFPPPEELSRMLREMGFTRVTYRRLTNGIAVIYTGVK